MTIADNIRKMSNEELANFIRDIYLKGIEDAYSNEIDVVLLFGDKAEKRLKEEIE